MGTRKKGKKEEVLVDDEQAHAEADRKRLAEIREQAQRANERHAEYLVAKEAAQAAKAQWESAAEDLQDLCLDREKPLPLLDAAPEDWQNVRLDSLAPAIKPAVLAKLKVASIETVGQLADYTKKHDILQIFGIGDAGKAQIEAALDAFWKSERFQASEPETASEPSAP